MGKVIGIDLGTTNSACAYIDGKEPQIIINEEGGRVTPSVVAISRTGERFVGDIAKRQLLIHPESTIHSAKRFMGKRYEEALEDIRMVGYEVVEADNGECAIRVNDRLYTPQEISAMILQKLRKSAEDFLGESVTEAVITVPAYFTDRQRQATKDAGTIAGLNVLRIINEPTAAALAYVHDRSESSTIAVYDFGGGTFDISILEVSRDVAQVLTTRGNNTLGGNDIDQLIVRWLLDQFREAHGVDVSEDRVAMQRLREAAERAKVALSTALETDIHLPFLVADASGPRHLQCTLTRATLEALAAPLFERTIEECRQALKDVRMTPSDIDDVILVGGSARIPRIQELVGELFGRPPNKSFNPDEVVAMGAAIQAGILDGEIKAVTLLDVTNFSLGIETEGRRFARLIPKNTPLPAQRTQLVSTVVDNQRVVKIHVLQGEHENARDNVSLGEFELSGIEPAPRGVPRIEVKFSIDTNGIVHVSATDKKTGVAEELTIRAPTSLTQVELERLQAEAQERWEQEQGSKELQAIRHQVEKQIIAMETFLRDNQGMLPRQDVFELEQALKRGRMALAKSTDVQNLEELSAYLARFQAHLTEKLGSPRSPIH